MTLTTRGPPLSPWQESFPPAPPWRIFSGNQTKNTVRIIGRLLVESKPSILSVLLADYQWKATLKCCDLLLVTSPPLNYFESRCSFCEGGVPKNIDIETNEVDQYTCTGHYIRNIFFRVFQSIRCNNFIEFLSQPFIHFESNEWCP